MRVLHALLVTALALAGLGACSDSGETPFELIATAGADTIEGGTAKVTLRQEISGIPDVDDITIEGSGAIDFEARRGSLDLDLGALLENLGVPDADDGLETVFEGSMAYLRASFLTEQLGVDTPWLSIDVNEAAEELAGLDVERLQQLTGNDPTQALGIFEGVMEDSIERVGEEEVRGSATTHYRATLDLRKAAREAEAITDRVAFERFLDSLGTSQLDVDLWVDDDGRLRRYRYDQALPPEAGGGQAAIALEYFDYGSDVDVRIPSVEETTDLLEVIGAGTG